MDTIDLKELFLYFKSKILIIFICIVLGFTVGGIYTLFIQKPVYESSTSILLIGDIKQNDGLTNNDVTLNQNLVNTYSEVIKSKRIINQVISNLDLKSNYKEVSDMVNVSSLNETEIIRVGVITRDKKLSKRIANEIANVFVGEVPTLFNISNVNILDKAEIAKVPYNVHVLKQFAIYIVAGLVIGCSIVFMMFYFDRTVKTKEDIETKIGLSVLGTIEGYRG